MKLNVFMGITFQFPCPKCNEEHNVMTNIFIHRYVKTSCKLGACNWLHRIMLAKVCKRVCSVAFRFNNGRMSY